MKYAVLFLAFLACSLSSVAQQVSCQTGQAINGASINMGATCTPVTGQIGTDVSQTGLTGALGSQTICDTSGACPAGFAVLCYTVAPTTTGTLVSAIGVNLTYTDDGGLHTNQSLNASVSLLAKTSVGACYPFYHAANTAVTLNTTVTGLFTGGPVYSVRTRLLW